MQVNFICPECGHDMLVEISTASESIPVVYAEKAPSGAALLDYGNSLGLEYDDSPQSYRCALCNKKIAETSEELYTWLAKRNMLEDA
jgi:DNA-directed RNA polymerase subunit RPC12/RpoP